MRNRFAHLMTRMVFLLSPFSFLLFPFSFNNVFFITPFRKREFLGERVVAEVLSFGKFYNLALE